MNILYTTSATPKKSPFFTNEKRLSLGLGSLMSVVKNEGYKNKYDYNGGFGVF